MGSPEEYLSRVTMSIRVMTAGDGYRYLLNSVVYGDGDHDASSALTRYYKQEHHQVHGSARASLGSLVTSPRERR